jgi:hypothetical protein
MKLYKNIFQTLLLEKASLSRAMTYQLLENVEQTMSCQQ